MLTTVKIDDALIIEALKIINAKSNDELINIALQELIVKYRRKDIKDIKGNIRFADGYDYKSLRKGEK